MMFSFFGPSIRNNVQSNLLLFSSVTFIALWLSHVIKSIQQQIVSIGPSSSQAVLPRWFENNNLMAFKLDKARVRVVGHYFLSFRFHRFDFEYSQIIVLTKIEATQAFPKSNSDE
jgi:hypothetical protein